jgi:hypothetical protein
MPIVPGNHKLAITKVKNVRDFHFGWLLIGKVNDSETGSNLSVFTSKIRNSKYAQGQNDQSHKQ